MVAAAVAAGLKLQNELDELWFFRHWVQRGWACLTDAAVWNEC